MRIWSVVWIVCAVVVHGSALAAPQASAESPQQIATQLYQAGEYQQAVEVIDRALVTAPRNLDLLNLKGSALLSLGDRAAAIAAYEAYIKAGARGKNRLLALDLIRSLRDSMPTILEITIANGPATIRLDLDRKPVCNGMTCERRIAPGRHKIVAERSGFDRWTGQVVVDKGSTTKLPITLVEKPSQLQVQAVPAEAQITVDGAPYTAPIALPAGPHQIAASLPGHRAERRDIVAHEGEPVDVSLSLTRIVPVRVTPTAAMNLDGAPIALEDGGLALAPGGHKLTLRAAGHIDLAVAIPAERGADYRIDATLAVIPPPPPSWFTLRRKISVGAAGVSLGAVAVGIVLGVQSGHRDDQARSLCPSPTMPCESAAQANALNQTAQQRAHQANLAYGVAGAAAAAATVLWLIGGPDARERIAVAPRLGNVTALDVIGRF